MKACARLALLAPLLGACTPAPTALDLGEEGELEELGDEDFQQIPEGEARVQAPVREEVPEVPEGKRVSPRYVLGGDGTIDDCVSVTAQGMPAIDSTGSLVATSQEHWLQLSSLHGRVELRLVDVDVPEASITIPVVPHEAAADDERECQRLRARVRAGVAAANAELAAHRWRALEPLAVEYGNPDATPEMREDVPKDERPLQVIVQHGEAVARIPGVKVHERHPTPGRSGYSLHDVHGDRHTGVVVLTFADCAGDSCTCDPLFTVEAMRWSPATFDVLDAHPCTDPEAEDGRCRGIDYGF